MSEGDSAALPRDFGVPSQPSRNRGEGIQASREAISAQPPILIVVSGVPGAGKSTLAGLLRQRMGWPVFNIDRIKETLFDASGMPVERLTQEISHQLGAMAEAAMLETAAELLRSGVPCIVESFFRPEAAAALRPIVALGRARQVHCTAEAHVSIGRYRERFELGTRHPVHLDSLEAADRATDPLPESDLLPVSLDVPVLSVETHAGYTPSLEAIVRFCQVGEA